MNSDEIQLLLTSTQEVTCQVGELLYKVGDDVTEVFVIIKGMYFSNFLLIPKGTTKEIITKKFAMFHGIGSIISYINLIEGKGKALTTCKVTQKLQATSIPTEVMHTLIRQNIEF